MLAKRIIPCLDVNHGRVVKGKQFHHLQDVDDPVALGKYYSDSGADELVFYDITATHEGRETFVDTVKAIAEDRGVRMPSFFGYMLWSVGILIPLFVVMTFMFF